MIKPLKEWIKTQEFGRTAFAQAHKNDIYSYTNGIHTGIDLRAGMGTPCFACETGTVILSNQVSDWGNQIRIDVGGGWVLLYAHLANRKVSEGDKVREGQIIGEADTTGTSTASHLHFETRWYGMWVNPDLYFYVRSIEKDRISFWQQRDELEKKLKEGMEVAQGTEKALRASLANSNKKEKECLEKLQAGEEVNNNMEKISELVSELVGKLSGKKTYLAAIAIGIVTALKVAGIIDDQMEQVIFSLLAAFGLATLRQGITTEVKKVAEENQK